MMPPVQNFRANFPRYGMGRKRVWRLALVALAIAAIAWCLTRRRGSSTERFLGASPPQTIFVSVASYRDVDCSDTIRDIFAKAADPARVMIGICEQNSEDGHEDCLPDSLAHFRKQVRRLTIPNTEARGPTYGRALIANVLYGGEDYFLQIDSHTRFVPHWDKLVVEQLAACPNASRAVLSNYPRSWTEYAKAVEPGAGVPVLCKSKIDPGTGVPNLEAVILKPGPKPRRVPFCSGGFLFGPGAMVREVPYDPTLDFVFVGEEILYAARLFTSGFDIYTPTRNICVHYYGRHDRPHFWSDLPAAGNIQRVSNAKVRRLLGFEQPPMSSQYPYGMGSARTLAQFWAYARIDPATKTANSAQDFCNWNAS